MAGADLEASASARPALVRRDVAERIRGQVNRTDCIDLDPNWPGTDGEPRGPTLCVLYPNCRCGTEDAKVAAAVALPAKRKPTRAALHRLIGVDTRITVAIAELTVGARDGARALEDLGIDLAPKIEALAADLAKIRAHTRSMFDETYPVQPGETGTNT